MKRFAASVVILSAVALMITLLVRSISERETDEAAKIIMELRAFISTDDSIISVGKIVAPDGTEGFKEICIFVSDSSDKSLSVRMLRSRFKEDIKDLDGEYGFILALVNDEKVKVIPFRTFGIPDEKSRNLYFPWLSKKMKRGGCIPYQGAFFEKEVVEFRSKKKAYRLLLRNKE